MSQRRREGQEGGGKHLGTAGNNSGRASRRISKRPTPFPPSLSLYLSPFSRSACPFRFSRVALSNTDTPDRYETILLNEAPLKLSPIGPGSPPVSRLKKRPRALRDSHGFGFAGPNVVRTTTSLEDIPKLRGISRRLIRFHLGMRDTAISMPVRPIDYSSTVRKTRAPHIRLHVYKRIRVLTCMRRIVSDIVSLYTVYYTHTAFPIGRDRYRGPLIFQGRSNAKSRGVLEQTRASPYSPLFRSPSSLMQSRWPLLEPYGRGSSFASGETRHT